MHYSYRYVKLIIKCWEMSQCVNVDGEGYFF